MPRIDLPAAISKLKKGELVALPTETVYGLAGRIDREETLRQIFQVKGRPFFDPLIVHVRDIHQAKGYVSTWPDIFEILASQFWPGPLTLVAPKNNKISSLISSGLDTVALRSPHHPMAQAVLRELGVPFAAPSANLFGHTSPTSADHVIQEFQDQVSVVDGGVCEVGVESTVVSAQKNQNNEWNVEILRPGGVSREQLQKTLNSTQISFTITRAISQASPGHLKHHYQPSSPVVIAQKKDNAVVLEALVGSGFTATEINWLDLGGDARLAARKLYQAFRELSKPSYAIGVVYQSHFESPEWEAIWDRISRAASLNLK